MKTENSGKTKYLLYYKTMIPQDTEIKKNSLLSIVINAKIHPLKFHVIKCFHCFLTQGMI